MSTTLELENENRANFREKLTLEKLEDGTVQVTVLEEEYCDSCWSDNAQFHIATCTLPKEHIVQVIGFLTTCLEK